MIKLKNLLKESYVWERKFGEKLPTLADVQKKKLKEDLLTEVKKIPYNENDWKKYQKMFEKLPRNKSLVVIGLQEKEYSWVDGSRQGIYVKDKTGSSDFLKHYEIEGLEIR